MSGRKYLFDEHFHAVHGYGSPATEQHCLKAAYGCLSCNSLTRGRPPGSPMLMEGVIWKIQAAAALYLHQDGSILPGKIGAVTSWEKENKIKLRWNNWVDVSLSFHYFSPNSWNANYLNAVMQFFILGERFQLYLSCVWCFMHMAVIGLCGKHICNSIVHKINTILRNHHLATMQRQADGTTKTKYVISEAALEAVYNRLLQTDAALSVEPCWFPATFKIHSTFQARVFTRQGHVCRCSYAAPHDGFAFCVAWSPDTRIQTYQKRTGRPRC